MFLPLKKEFAKEPFLLKLSLRNELKSFLVICVLIAFVLALIDPITGSGSKILSFFGFFIIAFVAFVINSLFNFYLVPNFTDISNWNIGKEITRRFSNLLVFSILICFYYSWVFQVNLRLTIKFFVLTIIFGLITIILKLNIKRSQYLKVTQDTILKSNELLHKKLDVIEENRLRFISNVTKESIVIDKKQLLLIEADGNYTIFHVVKNDKLEKIVFRCNLKNIEKQLDSSYLIRCHRSYILNLTNNIKFKRKANKIVYAKIEDYDFEIPVSKTQYRIVKTNYENIKASF